MKHLRLLTMLAATLLVAMASQPAFAHRDPMGYVDGMNLYQYEASSPVERVDPGGQDFIALGSRPVSGAGIASLGALNHYIVEYWTSCFNPPVGTILYSPAQQTQYQAKRKDNWQLLNNTSYSIWEAFPGLPTGKGGFGPFVWKVEPLDTIDLRGGISVIHHHDSKSVSTSIEVLYNGASSLSSPGSERKVAQEWKRISAFAKTYPYAEQEGFGGHFKHWPLSWYQLPGIHKPGNNSNTFARWLVKISGLSMTEFGGPHPGAKSPGQPRFYIYMPGGKRVPFIFKGDPFPSKSAPPPHP